jgi:hypothetical protein
MPQWGCSDDELTYVVGSAEQHLMLVMTDWSTRNFKQSSVPLCLLAAAAAAAAACRSYGQPVADDP